MEVAHDEPIREKRTVRLRLYPQLVLAFCVDLGTLNGNETRTLVEQTRESIERDFGLACAVGIAKRRFTALVAAHDAQADGSQVAAVAGKEADYLSGQSIQLLPIPASILERLYILGIRQLGQVAKLSREALYSQFGKRGLLAFQLAHGWDHRRVIAFRPPIVEQVEQHFDPPLS